MLLQNISNETDENFAEYYTPEENIESSINITALFILIYFTVLSIGICANVYLIISILRQKKNGTMYLILQFSFIDIMSTWVAVIEIWSLYTKNWNLNSNLCPVFFGTEVLVNVITVYLHILLNFHAISAWNAQQNIKMSNSNPLTSKVDESNECLVTRAENAIPNRTLNIDYRHKQSSVSIILPSTLIWFSCLSLSIPEFTLSTTVEYQSNRTLCTIVDLHYTQLLQLLLIVFRGIVPIPLLCLTSVIAVFKLFDNTSLSNVKKNCSAKKFKELKKLLQLSITLSLLYIISSLQRSLFHLLHTTSQEFDKTSLENFKMPPLDNIFLTDLTNLYLSMFHYSCIILRPILCIITIPSLAIPLNFCTIKNKDQNND